MMALLFAMVPGADSIDDCEVLRAGKTRRLLRVQAVLSDGAVVSGDEIFVAGGRWPLTVDLGLQTVGLEPGGFIAVDDQVHVSGVPGLHAIADVNGRSLLTHAGKHQAHVLSEILDGRASRGLGEQRGWSSTRAMA
jgi:dihydrolipoamide dehydrogenase